MTGRCVARLHKGERIEEPVCADGFCRACHVSLSFESCLDGSWAESQRRAAGLPATTPERTPA